MASSFISLFLNLYAFFLNSWSVTSWKIVSRQLPCDSESSCCVGILFPSRISLLWIGAGRLLKRILKRQPPRRFNLLSIRRLGQFLHFLFLVFWRKASIINSYEWTLSSFSFLFLYSLMDGRTRSLSPSISKP